MESCAECRARQQRERQYLERLRGAAVPAASDDLTARLLARTEQLAAERRRQNGTARPGAGRRTGRLRHRRTPRGTAGADPPVGREPAVGGSRQAAASMRRAARRPVAAGGAVAAVPSWPAPPTSWEATRCPPTARGAASHPDRRAARRGALRGLRRRRPAGPRDAGPASRSAWAASPTSPPPGRSAPEQLAALRAQGWTCPELRRPRVPPDLGPRPASWPGTSVLELRLTDGQHFATVLEQHAAGPGAPGGPRTPQPRPSFADQRADRPPAAADGFTAGRGRAAPPAAPEPGSGTLWINPAAALPGHLPDLRGHLHVRFGSARRAGRRRRCRRSTPAVSSRQLRRDAAPRATASRSGCERGLSRILELLAP